MKAERHTYIHYTQNVLRYSRKQQRVLRRPAFPPVSSRFLSSDRSCIMLCRPSLSRALSCIVAPLQPGPPDPKNVNQRPSTRAVLQAEGRLPQRSPARHRHGERDRGRGQRGAHGDPEHRHAAAQVLQSPLPVRRGGGPEARPLGGPPHHQLRQGTCWSWIFLVGHGLLDVKFIDIFFWLEPSRNVETVEGWARADGKGVWGEGSGGFFADMYSRLYVYCGLLVLWSRSTCCTRNASQPASPV